MLINHNQFDQLYDKMKERSRTTETEVLIFSAMDCDALCASVMMKTLFTYENVRFGIHPVSGYSDLQEKFEKHMAEQPSYCVMFVNCGGNVNMEEHFSLERYAGLAAKILMVVIDSHRPLDLANMQDFDEDQPFELCVLDSGESHEAPDISELMEMSSESDVSESESESDDSDGSESDAEQSPKQRRRVDEDGNAELDDNEEVDEVAERRHRRRKRKKRNKIQRQIEQYYSVTYFGSTASSFVFELASQLNQKVNKLLWLNIIALTDHHVHERYTGDQYDEKLAILNGEVGRLNAEEIDDEDRDGVPEQNRIAFVKEFRFMLPRFWTLYESMEHSTYVASRLGIWKEPGRRKLDTFLAKMGIPLAECKQKYSHMSFEVKQTLRERVEEYAEEFGLTELQYGSFEKRDGFKSKLAAADVVYGVNALLEQHEDKEGLDASVVTVQNYWRAFSALSGEEDSAAKLEKGFQLAITLQRLVVHQGKIVIEKNNISDCGKHFRWITMKETVDPYVFSHPLGLSKLALFLSSALRKQKRRARARPLVLASFVPAREMYLVVGVVGAPRVGDARLVHNKFGQLFRDAAEKTQAQVKHDSFDLSVIEIRAEDLRSVYDYLSINQR